ncbi:MAG: hypothetical protein J0H29_24285 [Sphingobacteriales bacterium]|nr:hypothetical protein [Sphingobacteriales bacterium]OJY91011.1 MAG: hypothetical protein BGP14_06350 [Sphingobacteriales bacterium 44-15]
MLPHVWVNDSEYINGSEKKAANAIVVQFVEDFLGEIFLQISKIERLTKILKLLANGLEIKGNTRKRINELMKQIPDASGLRRLSFLR